MKELLCDLLISLLHKCLEDNGKLASLDIPAKTPLLQLHSPSTSGTRIYSTDEFRRLGAEGINLLSYFEKSGVITPAKRETVINEVMSGELQNTISPHHLKVIILTVVEESIESPREMAWIQHLFFADPRAYPVQ